MPTPDKSSARDNTYVSSRKTLERIPVSRKVKARELDEKSRRKNGRVYDKNKADFYSHLQDFYNTNAFGYGVTGNQTDIDPTTEEGQAQITGHYNTALSNAEMAMGSFGTGAIDYGLQALKKVSPFYFRIRKMPDGTLGTFEDYEKYKIGEGATSTVFKNSRNTVGKINDYTLEEVEAMNKVPGAAPLKYMGDVKRGDVNLKVYLQDKVKMIKEDQLQKYVDQLDEMMEKSGYRRLQVEDDIAYTNGDMVVCDISADNIGVQNGKPVLIDFGYIPYEDWIALYKKGGKIGKFQIPYKPLTLEPESLRTTQQLTEPLTYIPAVPVSRQTYIGMPRDTRSEQQRKEDKARRDSEYEKQQYKKDKETAYKNLDNLLKPMFPSTYIGPLYKTVTGDGESFWDNFMQGNGFSNPWVSFAVDMGTTIPTMQWKIARGARNARIRLQKQIADKHQQMLDNGFEFEGKDIFDPFGLTGNNYVPVKGSKADKYRQYMQDNFGIELKDNPEKHVFDLFQEPGTVVKVVPQEQLKVFKNILGPDLNSRVFGLHDSYTGESLISVNSEIDPVTAWIHEVLSHGTDEQHFRTITNSLARSIGLKIDDSEPYWEMINKLGGLKPFSLDASYNPEELRATINQIRGKILDEIQYNRQALLDKYVNATSEESEKVILDWLKHINGYGQDYYNAIQTLRPEDPKYKEIINGLRYLIGYVPATAGAAYLIQDRNGNGEQKQNP